MACPAVDVVVWFAGQVIVRPVADAVVKTQIGPVVEPLKSLATTRHRYVTPADRATTNEHALAFAIVGVLGSVEVAVRYKSNCVARYDVQDSTFVMGTFVAPFDGWGHAGVVGNRAAAAVPCASSQAVKTRPLRSPPEQPRSRRVSKTQAFVVLRCMRRRTEGR